MELLYFTYVYFPVIDFIIQNHVCQNDILIFNRRDLNSDHGYSPA